MEIRQKEFIQDRDLLVICPTRQRIGKVKKMLKSYLSTASKEAGLLFCLDADDPDLDHYRGLFNQYSVAYTVNPRMDITQIFNFTFRELPNYKYYSQTNDDFIYETNHWDRLLIDVLNEDLNGTGIVFGNDGIQGENLPTTSIVSGNIVRALGWLQMPRLVHLFGDNVWKTIGSAINRLVYVEDVIIKHAHPIADKEQEDEIFKITNSKEMYQTDGKAFEVWLQVKAKDDITKVMRAILPAKTSTVSLCMIVSDQEKPEILERCLESVEGWIDDINIVFNWRDFPKSWRLKKLLDVQPLLKYQYVKWTDFSDMRNQSLKMALGDYCLWLDCDDVLEAPWRIKDYIFRYPEADYFKFDILSYTETGTKELIFHNRLFKNHKGFEFRNSVHEDVSFSMIEKGAAGHKTNITVHHMGNRSWKDVVRKNERNYKLVLEDIKKPEAHSLTYYAMVNCLMIKGQDLQQTSPKSNWQKYFKEAIQWIDKCFVDRPTSKEDPLTAKLWTLRGICCKVCGQITPAKQAFEKAWGEMQNVEAAVNLAECHICEKNFTKAIEILDQIYNMKEIVVTNMAVDVPDLMRLTLKKLGICWSNIANESKNAEDWKKAEKYYREFLKMVPNDIFANDALMRVLNNTGRFDEGAFLAVKLMNLQPKYPNSFYNFACYEIMNKRYVTAKMFLQQCLSINPNHKEAKHNLEQILKGALA